jgi:hypothetical protein
MNGDEKIVREEAQRPHTVRLPGFVSDEDVGLGDVVTHLTYAFGMRPCGGCAQRAATLNRWLAFSGRRGK